MHFKRMDGEDTRLCKHFSLTWQANVTRLCKHLSAHAGSSAWLLTAEANFVAISHISFSVAMLRVADLQLSTWCDARQMLQNVAHAVFTWWGQEGKHMAEGSLMSAVNLQSFSLLSLMFPSGYSALIGYCIEIKYLYNLLNIDDSILNYDIL